MNLLFWGLTVSVVGKVLLVIGILRAHSVISHEHKIDDKVLKSFKFERWLTIAGLVLIVLGYSMEIYFYGFTTLLTCSGVECTDAINAALSQ